MRWIRFFRRTRWDRERARELQSYLEIETEENMARGLPPDEARYAARRKLGNTTLVREEIYHMNSIGFLETLWQDLRYGLHQLRRSPGFTVVAISTLALGIGASTALFSVVNGVLLNPLPFPQPDRLVTLHESKPNFETGAIPYLNFVDWQNENHTFSSIAISRSYGFSLTGMGEAERLQGDWVSASFFQTLGVKPVVGRNFTPEEDRLGTGPVALISAGFWKRKFGSAPDVLGKSITLDGKSYTIVGVIPGGFDLRLGSFRPGEVYVPISQWNNPSLRDRKAALGLHGIGRMKPGITFDQAKADLQRIARNLAAAYPDANRGTTANILPLKQSMVGRIEPFLLVLLGAVGFVLLIACVNVANLLLARSTGRAHEFAIRTALGAGRRRIIRQLLTESVLLAVGGGGIGLILAVWGTKAAIGALPMALPRASEIGLDVRVLVFTAAISLLAGILFGLAPTLKTLKPDLHETLKEGGRGASGAHHRAHSVFVMVEMALALVLLAGAGLMIRSLTRLWNVNPGFDPEHVLTFGLGFPPSMMTASPTAIRAYLRQLDDNLESTPGVQAISLSWGGFPMGSEDDMHFWLEGQPKPQSESEMNWTLDYIVGPDYLKTMGIPLERGRFFTAQDDEHSPFVIVIDDIFAAKYFPNQNPVGKLLNLNSYGGKAEIIGVIGHVKQWGPDADDKNTLRAQLYLPLMQMPDAAMPFVPAGVDVVVRSTGTPLAAVDSIRRTVQKMNREQVAYGFEAMDEIISDSLAARQFSMVLLSAFAAMAVLLSSIGIYGVISYSVAQRTHEFGIRMALGAQRGDVLKLVVGEGLTMALIGVAAGLVAALALTRLMTSVLYGVKPNDPATFVAVPLLLIVVALAACYIPARRAAKIDPMVALRHE